MRLRESIVATLRYSHYFGFPLTRDEMYVRLIGKKTTPGVLTRTLSQMVNDGSMGKFGNYYYLTGYRSLISKRKEREQTSDILQAKAQYQVQKIKKVPGVLAIYLTGSLAVNNSHAQDDIDLMIVTENGRLWTTRTLLTLYTTLLGIRRTPNMSVYAGKLCLNLYLTPRGFSVPQDRRTLYTAYELVQAVPIYDPQDTHTRLLAANKWISKYLPNFSFSLGKHVMKTDRQLSHLVRSVESVMYHLQRAYMLRRLTREHVTENAAFFHPYDPGSHAIRALER